MENVMLTKIKNNERLGLDEVLKNKIPIKIFGIKPKIDTIKTKDDI
jgi:hypothetical protein